MNLNMLNIVLDVYKLRSLYNQIIDYFGNDIFWYHLMNLTGFRKKINYINISALCVGSYNNSYTYKCFLLN